PALKAIQRAKRRQGERFESWEAAYTCPLEQSEDKDIDRLGNSSIDKEGKNSTCFSYAIELNKEMEEMHEKIKNLQDEIVSLKKDRENVKSSGVHVLQELEGKLMGTTEEANRYEESCKESRRVLGLLRSEMETLFKEMGGDATQIQRRLGENGQITELDLMQFFDAVEQKTNELLLMESIRRSTSAEGSCSAQSFPDPSPAGTELLQVTAQAQPCSPPPALDSHTGRHRRL
ncbi:PREDICTED: coiled-coil domain-containing protein 63, partial [Eurypyga helias]|uniref:coiled-coil domain-containing protein 63 n=1 Tax=Eurypyga helias TaxID=54383 RepID=UPI00052853CB